VPGRAELARTDSHRFRILAPDNDRTKALRALTRSREDLVRTRIVMANQLRDQLACFWPGAGKVFCKIDSPIALAFLKRYPSPEDAKGLGEQRMAAFLARQGYNGRKSPRELVGRLRNGAHGRAGELETQARRQLVDLGPACAGRDLGSAGVLAGRHARVRLAVGPHLVHRGRYRPPLGRDRGVRANDPAPDR
jgi:Transposase